MNFFYAIFFKCFFVIQQIMHLGNRTKIKNFFNHRQLIFNYRNIFFQIPYNILIFNFLEIWGKAAWANAATCFHSFFFSFCLDAKGKEAKEKFCRRHGISFRRNALSVTPLKCSAEWGVNAPLRPSVSERGNISAA